MIKLNFNIGDIITTYHAGYWRVTGIERRFYNQRDEELNYGKVGNEYSPLIHYELVMDGSFNAPKKKVKTDSCDAGYCKKVTKEDLVNQIETLRKILKNY